MFMSVVYYALYSSDDTRKKNLEKILIKSGEQGEGGHENIGVQCERASTLGHDFRMGKDFQEGARNSENDQIALLS